MARRAKLTAEAVLEELELEFERDFDVEPMMPGSDDVFSDLEDIEDDDDIDDHCSLPHHYWSTDPALHYSPVVDRITRDRFREISRFLHFVDN